MSDSIKVAIKVRPLIKREVEESLPIQWTVQGNTIAPLDPELKKRGEGFSFDHIFDMSQTSDDLFNTVAKPIIDAAINGVNGTIFAYGQTGSGKTYTMMGCEDSPGVIPLATDYIFDAIANTYGREFLLRVSYIEIYNERINDLLDKNRIDLKIKEDSKTGQVVVDCKEEVINSPARVLVIMKKGDGNRRIGETNMNERSSRSHTIFRITIESRESNGDSDGAINVSQLNLVDLAGSERAGQTGATGERFNEGRHINLSLSSLGLVIKQLSECQDNPNKFVNFRDSKLTRILQASLGGNAMTTIICAVTPAALEETHCTLAFASRAKRVRNKPQVNEVLSDAALLRRYAKQMAKLKAELEVAKSADVVEMESKLLEKERANQILEERIELLKKSIVQGNNTPGDESFNRKANRRRTWCGSVTRPTKIPPFNKAIGLPTIKELDRTPEKVKKKEHIKRRQSIIQSLDIANQTFQTEFTDFELELIESERARDENQRLSCGSSNSEEDFFITRRPTRNVQFKDDVSIFGSSFNSVQTSPDRKSPERRSPERTGGEPPSPSTPKLVLRSRINFLMEEYNALRKDHQNLEEFAKLEKQMFVDDAVEKAMAEHRQALAASEQKCKEITEKYTKLESRSSLAEKRVAELEQQLAEEKARSSVERPSSLNNEKETSSIFANATYFEEMDVSDCQGETIFNDSQNLAELTDSSLINLTLSKLDESKKSKELSNAAYSEFMKHIGEKSSEEMTAALQELINAKLALEDENNKLQAMLRLKVREADDIKNDIRELKSGIEKLQETIHVLTSENTELTSKLGAEKEHAKETENGLQSTIAELNSSIASITEEKKSLESSIKDLNEQMKSNAISQRESEEELFIQVAKYRKEIASLTAENVDLSTNLMSKIEELDRIKDERAPPGEHECAYRELSINLSERNRLLEEENIKLSNDLMDKIEEYDRVKDEIDEIRAKFSSPIVPNESKLLQISMNKSSNLLEDEVSKAESNESLKNNKMNNSKESTNQTVDDLLRFSMGPDNSLKQVSVGSDLCKNGLDLVTTSSASENSMSNGCHRENSNSRSFESTLPAPLIENLMEISVTNGSESNVSDEQSENAWKIKAEMLQEEVNHLNVLNNRLSELKITSCTQCAHLTELNENRKALKLEAKALHRKLRELQEKFDRECADSELLRTKANEDLNLSVCDATFNGSMMIEGNLNVTFVEEKVQALHQELVALRENHDKLADLYKEKCEEIDKLQDASSRETTPTPTSSNESPRDKKNDDKLERIRTDMDKLRNDYRVYKKNISSISSALQRFVTERAVMQKEIEALRGERASFVAAPESEALERVSFLENEVQRLSGEISRLGVANEELEKSNEALRAKRASLVAAPESEALERVSFLENEVQRLSGEISRLGVANEELEKSNEALKTEVQSLKDNKTTLEEKINSELPQDALEAITNLNKEKSSLESAVEALRAEKTLLEQKPEVSFMQNRIKCLENETSFLESEKVKYLEEEVRRLSEETRQSNILKEELQQIKSALEAEVQLLKIEKNHETISTLAKESSMKEKIEFLESEAASLKNQSSSFVQRDSTEDEDDRMSVDEEPVEPRDASMSQETMKYLEDEVSRLSQEINNSNVAKEELESTKCSLEAEVQSLKARAVIEKMTQTDGSCAQERIRLLEEEVARLNVEITHSTDVREQLELAKSSLEAEVIYLKEERASSESETAQERIDNLESEIIRLRDEIDGSELQNKQVESMKSELEAQITALQSQSEAREQRIEELAQEIRDLELSNSELEAKLQAVTSEREELLGKIVSEPRREGSLGESEKDVDELVESLRTKLNKANEDLQSHVQTVEQLNERLDVVKASEEQLNAAKIKLEAEVAALKAERVDYENSLSELRKSVELLGGQDEGRNSSSVEHLNAVKIQLEAEVAALKSERVDHENSLGELRKSVEVLGGQDEGRRSSSMENVNDTVNKIQEVEMLLGESEKRNLDLKEKLQQFEGFEEELTSAKEEIARLRAEVRSLEASLESLKVSEELERTKTKEGIEDDEEKRLYETHKEYERMIEELRTKLKDISNDLQVNAKETEELNEEMNKLSQAKDELNSARTALESEVSCLRMERDELAENIGALRQFGTELEKRNVALELEVNTLQTEKERVVEIVRENVENVDLGDYEEMVSSLASRLREMTKQFENYSANNVELNSKIEELQEKLEKANLEEKMLEERKDLEVDVEVLRRSSKELEERNAALELEVQRLQTEKQKIIQTLKENVENLDLEDYEEAITTLTSKLKETTKLLDNATANNSELGSRLQELQQKVEDSNLEEKKLKERENLDKSLTSPSKKHLDELHSARGSIIKEIKSLKPSTESTEFSRKSISELFALFVHTIMSKEQEIIKALTVRFEKEKRKLEEENRQSCDAEKRASAWAKELEADTERTQRDLSRLESKATELNNEIARLQNLLKESAHENQLLNEKMEVLELDFNTLQAELEKHNSGKQNTSLNLTQERERLIQEAVDTRELELSAKLRLLEKQSKERVEDLTKSLEAYKTKSIELKNNVEGLEANERQLRSIAEMKTNELVKANATLEKLKRELEVLNENHNRLSEQHSQTTRQMEEISSVMKTKCDKLSEYKTKLETITPEYEHLKEQAAERQQRLEKYKSEIECLTSENESQVASLKDKLDSEEIKSSVYRKQLADLTNRNTILQTELLEMKAKCEELETSNAKLAKSMRNSLSKVRAEEEMEELRDRNRTLQRNLEGASNRIAELQEMKSQVVKEMVELRCRYDEVCNENEEAKSALSLHKTSVSQTVELRAKYESLLQEKNRIELELGATKSKLAHVENKHKDCEKEIEELKMANKQLDEEMEDIVSHIHELKKENAELDDKLFTLTAAGQANGAEKGRSVEEIGRLKAQMQKLGLELESLRLQNERLQADLATEAKTLESLRRENSELRIKVGHLDREESLSCDTSRSASPAMESVRVDSRRRRSRTELFNQKRQLQIFEPEGQSCCGLCRCSILQEQVCELQRELVTKNGEIAAMEIRIQSENFPHMKRCKDLEEVVASSRRKVKHLEAELQKLREQKVTELSSECDKCRHWRANKRDQSTQCLPKSSPIYLSGMSSGIVEDHVKMAKLQKDKEILKTLCRGRQKQIIELESKLKELEKEFNAKSSIVDEERPDTTGASSLSSISKHENAINSRQ